jgi:hypothetical protein
MAVMVFAGCCLATRLAAAAPPVQVAVGPGIACPSAEDLRRSLAARVRAEPADAQPLSLRIEQRGAGSLRLQLSTAGGDPLLTRDLDEGGGSCVALADTAAIMVDRYLREIAYRAEPPALPEATPAVVAAPARAAVQERPAVELPALALMVGVGVGSRSGLGTGGGQTRGELRLVVGLEGHRLALWAEGGLAGAEDVRVVGGTGSEVALRVHPYPARLLAGVVLGGPALAVIPLLGVSADLLAAEASTATASTRSWRVEAGAEAGVALRWAPSRSLWMRAALLGGATLRARDYLVTDGENPPAFRTPGAFARLGLEAGLAWGKK